MQQDDQVEQVRQAIHFLASGNSDEQVKGQNIVRAMTPRAVELLLAAFKIQPRRIRTTNSQAYGLGFVVTMFFGMMLLPPLFKQMIPSAPVVTGYAAAMVIAFMVWSAIRVSLAIKRRQGWLALLGSDSNAWPTEKVNRNLLLEALGQVEDIRAIGPMVDVLPSPAALHVEPAMIPLLDRLGAESTTILDTVQRIRLYRSLVSGHPDVRYYAEDSVKIIDFQIAVLKLVEVSRDKTSMGFVRQASDRKLRTEEDRKLAEAAKACLASFSRGRAPVQG